MEVAPGSDSVEDDTDLIKVEVCSELAAAVGCPEVV